MSKRSKANRTTIGDTFLGEMTEFMSRVPDRDPKDLERDPLDLEREAREFELEMREIQRQPD